MSVLLLARFYPSRCPISAGPARFKGAARDSTRVIDQEWMPAGLPRLWAVGRFAFEDFSLTDFNVATRSVLC
jgi:hypothetical protein